MGTNEKKVILNDIDDMLKVPGMSREYYVKLNTIKRNVGFMAGRYEDALDQLRAIQRMWDDYSA